MDDELGVSDPSARIRYAIIVPCYGHPNLVREALQSAVDQHGDEPYAIVIVNDGCRFAETDQVARFYAGLYPGRVFYKSKRNSGLGDSRNVAVDFALNTFANLDYIFFLDADNRLLKNFMTQSAMRIAENITSDVLYFSTPSFGSDEHFDVSGSYSFGEHLLVNPIDAGSWVKADIFRAGHRYYTDKPMGYEDWQLFLTLGAASRTLTHIANPGFLYRRRPESMVSETNAMHDEVMSRIRRDLGRAVNHDAMILDEHGHFPRFALWESDGPSVRLVTDPGHPPAVAAGSPAEALGRMLRSRFEIRKAAFPPYNVFAGSEFYRQAGDRRLIRAVLLAIERALAAGRKAVFVELRGGRGGAVGVLPADRRALRTFDAVAVHRDVLTEAAMDQDASALLASLLDGEGPQDDAGALILSAPVGEGDVARRPSAELMGFVAALVEEARVQWDREPVRRRFDFRELYISDRRRSEETVRLALGYGPVMPRYAAPGHPRACVAVATLGGSDAGGPALETVSRLKELGYEVMLLVTGASTAALSGPLLDGLDDVVFLHDAAAGRWSARPRYFGSMLPAFDQEGDVRALLGLISGCAVIVNVDAGELHGVMRAARKNGARTVMSLQAPEVSPHGHFVGQAHALLAYEHVYDAILVPSEGLADFCAAHGVPHEKLHLWGPTASAQDLAAALALPVGSARPVSSAEGAIH